MERLVEWLGGETAVLHVLAVGALVAARVAPLSVIAPWIALKGAPVLVRTAIVLALTVSLAPLALELAPASLPGGWELAVLALRETLVGSVFALLSSLPFFAVDWAGRLTDTWRGASLAEVIAPHSGERTSPMGDLYLLGGIAFFVAIGGHRLAIAAFAEGLSAVPPGTVDLAGGIPEAALSTMRLAASALAFAAAVAAPAAVAIVLVEVSLGLVARAAPQIPVFFAGMPLRAATGIAAALLAASVLVGELPLAFREAIDSAARVVLPF